MQTNYYTFFFITFLSFGMFLFFKGLSCFSINLNFFQNLTLFKRINSSPYIIIIIYGFIFSSIIQSSSLCISIIIPLIGLNILSLNTCFYLIIGFNIGTVSSLFLNGIDLNILSLILLIFSVLFYIIAFIKKNEKPIFISNLFIGITLLILGLSIIKKSFLFFQQTHLYYIILSNLTKNLFNPFLIGIILSAIIQSGSIISTVFQNIYISTDVNLIYIIMIILGSNIGSTITGILASLYFDKKAKTVAHFHVLLNLIGVLVTLSIFNHFTSFIIFLSNLLNQPKGFDIAITHLLFNLLASLIILPFISILQKKLFLYTN